MLVAKLKQEETRAVSRAKTPAPSCTAEVTTNYLAQKVIEVEDICPICQDNFLGKKLPVTYCRFGCGNNVHIKCMKVWADHQKSGGEASIKCPLCREDFGPIEMLNRELKNSGATASLVQQNRHMGVACRRCHVSPIIGKCYRLVSVNN